MDFGGVTCRSETIGVPEASFHDPNEIDAELEAIVEGERKVEEALKGDTPASESHFWPLIGILDAMTHSKSASSRGRNTWQGRAVGGEGEPFYRDSAGFETAIRMTIEHSWKVFAEKWGHRDCDIRVIGLMPEDAWRIEHDWKE
ncbi:hypothetical protein B0J14DRAFT_563729 [Halenospora varia]|nr:hypothetical protein B0J14DRAFT_563729 [Halenospora varia]